MHKPFKPTDSGTFRALTNLQDMCPNNNGNLESLCYRENPPPMINEKMIAARRSLHGLSRNMERHSHSTDLLYGFDDIVLKIFSLLMFCSGQGFFQ